VSPLRTLLKAETMSLPSRVAHLPLAMARSAFDMVTIMASMAERPVLERYWSLCKSWCSSCRRLAIAF
jgi:hypothetical protein